MEHGPLPANGRCIGAMAEGRQQLARSRVVDGLTGRCQGRDEDLLQASHALGQGTEENEGAIRGRELLKTGSGYACFGSPTA